MVSIAFLFLIGFIATVSSNFDSYFNDRLLYTISYLSNDQLAAVPSESNFVPLKSSDNENYQCLLPEIQFTDNTQIEIYTGPTPAKLIEAIHKLKECSLKIDSYWFYELCHGQKLRQFHEDKANHKTTEYILGHYQAAPWDQADNFDQLNPPKFEFAGQQLAYFPVHYKNGSICDLTKEPRTTTVYYVCDERIPLAALWSLQETQTCEYLAIVATNQLCLHPAYRKPKIEQFEIKCYAADENTSAPPVAYNQFKNDDHNFEDFSSILERRAGVQQRMNNLLEDLSELPHSRSSIPKAIKMVLEKKSSNFKTLLKIVENFFSGKQCLHGVVTGSSYWKIETCFRKKIVQYHEEDGKRTEIVLGRYSEKIQHDWAKSNSERLKEYDDEGMISQVINFYGHGETCEETGKPRSVELKLSCSLGKNMIDNLGLKQYMVERSKCQYDVIIESGLLCSYIAKTNDLGIYKEESLLDYMPMLLDALKDFNTDGEFVIYKKEILKTTSDDDEEEPVKEKEEDINELINYLHVQP
ncbi:Endoplasmic reticulum lectin 1 [Aphelenchoides besseyi]|nr:Endoplasmic reticulum lectin 1 [Aphelenchoides besseyi]KAI6207870.1 Endoplasmic reticulum lectin 1 [Aphelenchoides besseyi]